MKVSIVIPAYNHEKYVQDAIKSALDQTYLNTEIIIIDDGSIDNTVELCKKLRKQYSKIRFWEQKNQGAHATINRAIEKSNGDYITILNSDDLYMPDKIERCVNIIKRNSDIEIVYGDVEFIDGNGNLLKEGTSVDWQKRAYTFLKKSELMILSILNENFIATTSNLFFSRRLWERVNGFQPLRYCHDLDFLLSCIKASNYYFDKEAVHIKYRVHQSNTIKEDLLKIRVEIAAVIAVSIVTNNMNLIGEISNNKLQMFREFLLNKNLSNLIIFMIMYYLKIKNKSIFYDFIMKDEIKSLLISLL